jgi:serine/threonine protein kinase/Flp pilus assembly protein TadD
MAATVSCDVDFARLVDRVSAALLAREPLDLDHLIAENPEHEDRLRQLWPALQLLAEASGPDRQPITLGFSDDDIAHGALGDFRLIREVGRGGMGIVYEAEQISLNRNVALKVLPFAATMDPRHLQRFRNEAQAAACLHHPNIVPVHGVGCDRGVHYYAMQLIEGQTLAEVIQNLTPRPPSRSGKGEGATPPQPLLEAERGSGFLPSPPASGGEGMGVRVVHSTAPNALLSTKRDRAHFRSIATLIASAADALEYAHSMGVVHRDIKPANLMLDFSPLPAPGRGDGGEGAHLWITDFGLAKLQSPDRQGGDLTLTGDVIGTLRYMSPEQALAKHGLVDHRTDIYSLGATLYELLTLKPAVPGNDKAEILKAIAWGEPIPLRKHDKSIPAELETITLKCLAKEPGERYATAGEVAEDLRRWLGDRAIKARPATLWQRTRKWSRRHPAATFALSVGTFVALAVIGGWYHQKAVAEATARAVLPEVEELQAAGRYVEALAVARRAGDLLPRFGGDAELRRIVDEQIADIAFQARVEEIRLEQSGLEIDHFDQNAAKPLYPQAFLDYGVDVVSGEESAVVASLSRRAIRTELVAALDGWSLVADPPIADKLNRLVQALEPDGITARAALACRARDREALKRLVGEVAGDTPVPVISSLAFNLLRAQEKADAELLLRTALKDYPGDFWLNSDLGLHLLGANWTSRDVDTVAIDSARTAEALVYLRAALAVRPNSPGAWINVGVALSKLGRPEDAAGAYGRAATLNPDYAAAHRNLGLVLARLERFSEAEAAFRRVLELKPRDALALCDVGFSLLRQGRYQEAVEYLSRGIERHPVDEGIAYDHLGEALEKLGRSEEALTAWRKAIHLQPENHHAYVHLGDALTKLKRPQEAIEPLRRIIKLKPKVADPRASLASALIELGQLDEALKELRTAIEIVPTYAVAHFYLGKALDRAGNRNEALSAYRRAAELDPTDPNLQYDLACTAEAAGLIDEAERAYRRSIQLNAERAEPHCNLGLLLMRNGRSFSEALAQLRRGHELGSRQKGWSYPSENWVRIAERCVAYEPKLAKILAGEAPPTDAGELLRFADLCANYKKNYPLAVRFYAAAFEADPKMSSDLDAANRFFAAASAVKAAAQSVESAQTAEIQRARFRQQAHDWLVADLADWNNLTSDSSKWSAVRGILTYWQQVPDFASVRDEEALAKLPTREREPWRKLWADVATTLAKVQQQNPSTEKSEKKP